MERSNVSPIYLLSKYRNMLMGIAIFEVMLGHVVSWLEISYPNAILGFVIARMYYTVHTPGFLLLSGLGLYYSFSKNNDVSSFYLRRMQRMWLPFMIIAAVFYAVILLKEGAFNIVSYLGLVTALGYWFGDTNMWYIALSIILYAIFPVAYKWMKINWKLHTIIIVVFTLLLGYLLNTFVPSYFEKVFLAIPKIPMFFVGVYIGYLIKENVKVNLPRMGILCLIVSIFFFGLSRINHFFMYYSDLALFPTTIWIVAYLYSKLENFKIIQCLIKIWSWFGKYTLELYVLHLLIARIINPGNNFYLISLVIILSLLLCVPVQRVTISLSKLIIKKL